jgi:hypothetical protein
MSDTATKEIRRGRKADGRERVKIGLSVYKESAEELARLAELRQCTMSDVFNRAFRPKGGTSAP